MQELAKQIVLTSESTPWDGRAALLEKYSDLYREGARPFQSEDCDLFINAVTLMAADVQTLMPNVSGMPGSVMTASYEILHALDIFSNRLPFSTTQRPQAYEALHKLFFDTDVCRWGTIGMGPQEEAARMVIGAIKNMRRNDQQARIFDLTAESL